jgi:hypothetical protein
MSDSSGKALGLSFRLTINPRLLVENRIDSISAANCSSDDRLQRSIWTGLMVTIRMGDGMGQSTFRRLPGKVWTYTINGWASRCIRGRFTSAMALGWR